MKSVKIGDTTYWLPFVDHIPFDPHQLRDLGQSIEEVGKILVAVVCWREKATPTAEWVVDGAHRVLEAHRLGIAVPIVHISYASEEEAREDCERLNSDRRQMSPTQLVARREKRIQRVAKLSAGGDSTRKIAEKLKVSQSQVVADIKAATEQGCSVAPPDGKVTGLDGRTTKPASKPSIFCERCTRVGPVKDCEVCAEMRKPKKKPKRIGVIREPGDEADQFDHFKKAVPEPLQEVFERVAEFRSIMHALAELRSRIETLGDHKAGAFIDKQDTDRMLKQAHAHLRFAMPYTECPKCKRKAEKKCPACKGTGWIHETMFRSSASDVDKRWLGDRK